VVSAGGESESRRARFAVWLLLPLALMSCSAQRGSKPSATPEGRHQFMTEQDEGPTAGGPPPPDRRSAERPATASDPTICCRSTFPIW
jgi:hypothetical protein